MVLNHYIYYLDKGKGGKNAKTISPVHDGPIESDTSRPLDSEEIQALAIRFDELEKVYRWKIKFEYFVIFSYIEIKVARSWLMKKNDRNLLL